MQTTVPTRKKTAIGAVVALTVIILIAVAYVVYATLFYSPTSTVPFQPDYITRNATAHIVTDKPAYQGEAEQVIKSTSVIYPQTTIITIGDLKPEGHTITLDYLMPSGSMSDKELMLSTLHSLKQAVPALFRDVPTAQYLIISGVCNLKNDATCITFRLTRQEASLENWTTITADRLRLLDSRAVKVEVTELQQAWASIGGEK